MPQARAVAASTCAASDMKGKYSDRAGRRAGAHLADVGRAVGRAAAAARGRAAASAPRADFRARGPQAVEVGLAAG